MIKKTAIAWGKASDELKAKVKFVLQQAQHSNKYSVSRIYAAHNAVFNLKEEPQTCSTCLTSRVAALRKWWSENEPKTDKVATTGEAQEATSYDGVVSKYKINFDGGSELDTLGTFLTAGAATDKVGKGGISENELELLRQRHNELTAAHHETDLQTRINGKLAELGVDGDSTDAEVFEAYEVLAASPDTAEDERTQLNAALEVYHRQAADNLKTIDDNAPNPADIDASKLGYKILNMGAEVMGMHFTPNDGDTAKGTVLNADGSKVKAGTYKTADGRTVSVQVGGKASIK